MKILVESLIRIPPPIKCSTNLNNRSQGRSDSITTTTFLSRPTVQGLIIAYCLISQLIVSTCLCTEEPLREQLNDVLQSIGYFGISMVVQLGTIIIIRLTVRM